MPPPGGLAINKIANAPITNRRTGGTPMSAEQTDEQWTKDILAELNTLLEKLSADTKAEMRKIDRGQVTVKRGELPSEYGKHFYSRLFRINALLYEYYRSYWFDPCKIAWQLNNPAYATDRCLIDIQVHTDFVIFKLPFLPPRGKGRRAEDILGDALLAKLSSVHSFPRWDGYHAEFIHVFPKDAEQSAKDVDNYEYKRVIDIIAFAMHFSDSPSVFSMEMRAVFTDELPSGVYIEITPKSSENAVFPRWKNEGS